MEGDHHPGSGFGARARLPEIRGRGLGGGGKSFVNVSIFIIIGRIGKGFNVPVKEFIKNLKFNLTQPSKFQHPFVDASLLGFLPLTSAANNFQERGNSFLCKSSKLASFIF